MCFSEWFEMVASSPASSLPQSDFPVDFCQGLETISFLVENVPKAVQAMIRDHKIVQGPGIIVLDCQISFLELMVDVDLGAHQLSLQQVDLPLSYPEILVLCQSYTLVDPSFVSKLAKMDMGSWFLILIGVGRVMGLFLAFSPGQILLVVHQYMVSLKRLIQLMTKALGFELELLQKIVVRSHDHTHPLLSLEGWEQLLGSLKQRRASTTEFVMGNRSMELLVQSSQDIKKDGPSV